MLKNILICFAFIALVSCREQPSSPAQLVKKLDSIFVAVPDFSGVVLIADGGSPVYHRAFGFADFRLQHPLDTGAVFELASVSKQFTAMVIMMLEEEGKLDYDEPVSLYLPDLPYPDVTVRHLLNHTSGLPDYQAVMDQHWDKSKVAGNEDNIAYLTKYRPDKHFVPGERYEYSNTGYMLLASIAEKASGQDFVELCRTRIFRPLNMSSTDIRTRDEKNALTTMAAGHSYVDDRLEYVPADSFPEFNYSIWLGNRKGPGRISSTASDLLKWDRALYGTTLVNQGSIQEAFSPAALNNGQRSLYGFGHMLSEAEGVGRRIFHTGDNPGYKTIFIRYIDQDMTAIMLCNNAHKQFHKMVFDVETELASYMRAK